VNESFYINELLSFLGDNSQPALFLTSWLLWDMVLHSLQPFFLVFANVTLVDYFPDHSNVNYIITYIIYFVNM